MNATKSTDRLTGRSWLEFTAQPAPETIAALKANGWRWSGYRKAWHHPSRWAKVPEGIEIDDGGLVDYSGERADRLEARSERVHSVGDAAYSRAAKLADAIPLGQPILVGHHSEKRARRDAERIRTGFGRAFDAYRKGDALEAKAESSRAHQEHLQAAGTISRRLERLRAELRKLQRYLADAERRAAASAGPYCADPACQCPDRERPPPVPGSELLDQVQQWREKVSFYEAEISRAEAGLEAAGGLRADAVEVKVGDVIRIRGHIVRVERVNRKSFSGTIVQGGAAGMSGKWDRSWLQEVVLRSGEVSQGLEVQP